MTLFLDKMRGTPEDIYGKKVLHLVAQMSYPAVVGFLAEKCGTKDALIHLRDLGSHICQKLMKVYKPKKKKLSELIKEFFNIVWEAKKITVKVIEKDKLKRPTKIKVTDRDCGLCPKEEELIPIEGLNYCAAVSGFLETMLNELNAKKYPLGIKKTENTNIKFKVDTIASRGPSSKKCIHQIEIFY